MTYCFIVNPVAGGGGHNWPALQQRLRAAGIDYCHYQSEYPGHCRELVGHLPVEIEILPRALRVLIPEGSG